LRNICTDAELVACGMTRAAELREAIGLMMRLISRWPMCRNLHIASDSLEPTLEPDESGLPN
jgi:hypothetical protein